MRLIVYLILGLIPASLLAQTVTLRGQVTDESGAAVPAANVVLNGLSGDIKKTRSEKDGGYVFSELPPGDYTISANAPQLILREPVSVSIRSASQTVNLVLQVFLENQQVTVEENAKPASAQTLLRMPALW